MNLNKILLIAFGFLLSIEQGFTLVLGTLSNGTLRGADVLMPVDVAMYALFLFKKPRRVPAKYRTVFIFAITVAVLFLLWSYVGEFVAVEKADFRFGAVHLTRSVLVFICILMRVNAKQDIVDFTRGVMYGLGFEAVVGVYQWLIGPIFIPFLRIVNDWRATGTLGVANAFGCYLAALVQISIRLALFCKQKPKWLWYGITVLSLGALLATYTRGAWLGFALATVVFYLLDFINGKLTARQSYWLIFVFAVGFAFTYIKYGDVITGRMSDSRDSMMGEQKHSRLNLAKDAIRIIKENPVTGVGLDNYRYHADAEIGGTRIVHNAYLLITAQQGIPGAALFVLLNLTLFIVGFKILKSQDATLYHIGMAGMMGLLSMLVYHLAAPDYRLVVVGMLHWRGMAMVLAVLIADERNKQLRQQLLTKKKPVNRGLRTPHSPQQLPYETVTQKY